MANNNKENKIKKFTKEAIGKTLNQFNKEIGIADLVEINKNQDRILNGILSQVNDENTEKTEKSNIITLDNSTDGIVELKEIQGDTNVNVSKIEEMPITHDIGEKEGNVFTLNEITQGAISIGEIQGNTMVNCNKDDKKELVLMKDLSTQGDNNITLTEGVDGGKVDVALEGNTLVNVSKTKDDYITHEREEDTTGNHVALADEGYIRPMLNGKTMVNVCDQKDITAVTKAYTVENSGNHIALQDDIDGSCRPVITGNTLVNLAGEKLKTYSDKLVMTEDSITYDLPSGNGQPGLYANFSYSLKPSTEYTVIFNILDYKAGTLHLRFRENNTAGSSESYVSGSGMYKIKITTNSESSSTALMMFNRNGVDNQYTISRDVIILEGDYSDKPIPDYFTGLQSSFEDNLVTQEMVDSGEEVTDNLGKYRVDYKVTGKNKIDNDLLIEGVTLSNTNGTETTGVKEYKATKEYISVTPGANLRLSLNAGEFVNLNIICFYDNEYNFISSVKDSYTHNQIVVPKNAKYLRLRVATQATDVQLEEGIEVTSYEPYKEYTKTLYLNSPLLEGDTIEERNGSIYHVHRYGTMNLYDCHKNNYTVWHSDGVTNGINWFWSNTLHESKLGTYITLTYDTFSDKIAYIKQGNAINIGFPEGVLSSNDDAGVKAWIRANNPNVVYKLKTPKYETISEDSIVCDSYVSGHLDFNTAIPIEKIEFKNTILENKYLYTNTEYTIQFEADKEGKAVISLGGTTLAETSIVKGINKIVITTPETLTDNNLILEGIGFNISDIVVTPTIEQDFGYFGGLSSTFEDRLVPENILGEKVTNIINKVEYSLTKNIKPNTTYTIYLEGAGVLYCGFQKDSNWVKYLSPSQCIHTITTDDNVDINKLSLHSSENIRVDKCFLLEGDYANYNFSDYDPTKVGKYKVDYKVTGKNKFDINKPFTLNYGRDNAGSNVTVSGNGLFTSGLVGVISSKSQDYTNILKPNTDYTISAKSIGCNYYLRVYDNSTFKDIVPNFIVNTTNRSSATFNIGNINPKDIRILFHRTEDISDSSIVDIQLEEGTQATPYEPYKESTKTLYLNSPLLEGDTIEEKDGGIYHVHRYTETILDGSLFNNMDSDMNGLHRYYSYNYRCLNYALGENKCYCDKLPVSTMPKIDGSITFSGSGYIEYATTKSMSEAQEWLQQNSVTIVYELAEPTYELIEQSNLAIPSYSNGHLDLTSAVPISKVNFLHFEEDLTYLYPATSYTLQFISDKAISVDITLGGTQLLAQNIVKGLNRITITTPETLADNRLVIDGVGASISNVVVTDTDREFMYFEGMKSVGECEGKVYVASNNGNLFEGELIPGRYTVNQGIWFADNTTVCTKEKIKVNPNTRYKIILPENVSVYNISEYSCDIHIKNHYSYPFTTSPNATHINISLRTTDINTRFCLVKNDSTINIDTAQSNIQQLTHEPLRSVGNVKDRYVLIDGKWYIERKCKEVVLDGSKDWTINDQAGNNGDYYLVYYHPEDILMKDSWGNLVSDKYFTYNNSISNCWNTKEWISLHGWGFGIGINISKSKLTSINIPGFKQWLSKNPTKVVYPLASPVYEPIDYNPLEVYADMTHISTNSAIPTNMVIKNHGFNCLLKPSTTYTVSSNLGLNTVTTGADIGDSCLRFYDTDTSDKTIMKDVLILEGDWTTKADLIPCNFSGIESCFEQELVTDKNDEHYGKYRVNVRVVGKNFVDSIVTDMQHSTGKYVCSLNYSKFEGVIPLPKGTYRLSFEKGFNSFNDGGIRIWSKDGTYRQNKIEKYFEIKHNEVGFTWYCYPNISDVTSAIGTHIQVESGTNKTAYEPYKESDVTFYIDEPLRGTGDTKDKVYVKDDKVVVERNCGSVTLDGSDDEVWVDWGKNNGGVYRYAISQLGSKKQVQGMCDSFIYEKTITANTNYECAGVHSTNDYIVICVKNKTLVELMQYLSQNPTTVVYQLAEPTYEEVEYSSNRLILNTFNNESFNNSTLFLDTNILPKLSFKPLYEELVYVKNSTKYYIQFNAVGSGEVVINLGGTEITTEIVEGYNCIPITTPSESTNLMTIIGQGITISEVVVSEVICGGYYKGLQSCFEEHMENGKYRVLLRGIALDGSKVNGIKLYINEPLRGVGNIKDRLCIKNGKLMIERKYGSVILDGSDDERWAVSGNPPISDSLLEFTKKLSECKVLTDLISNNFSMQQENAEGFKNTSGVYNLRLFINKVRLQTQDLTGFIQWLQQNPLTVVYQLAEPTYEEVTNEYGLPIIFEGYENGIVYIDSAVTPTTHIKYTSNNQLATTLAEAEEQNITTQEDINMNVITYMMDIDMMLTDMEMSNDISVMAVRRDSSNENMLDRMSDEDKKVYRDNTVVMLEKMITANVLDKEDIEGRIDMYYNKNRISKEQYKYLKSLL